MGEDHQEDQDSALSHEIKAQQIKRLQPFYQQRLPYILRSFASLIYHNVTTINTDDYEHKSIENYSESQIINRTVFALQKLQLLNPNFFTPQEYLLTYSQKSNIVWNSIIYSIIHVLSHECNLWIVFIQDMEFQCQISWSLGCIFSYLISLRLIQIFYAKLLFTRRKILAKQYLEIYGPIYFHQIIDLRFSVHKLETLKKIA